MHDGPRPLLLIAHPGHELRLFGWLRQARPLVAILTDGSGSTGKSRIDLSGQLVAQLGGEIVMSGIFAEPVLYAMMLRGDAAALLQVAEDIARVISDEGATMLVSDACEGYHPGHDICSPLLGRAAWLAGRRCSLPARHLEYRVIGKPGPSGIDAFVLKLDDATLHDKIDASRRYADASGNVLQQEVQYMFDTYGEESFRYEAFSPAGAEAPQLYDGLRYYEVRGEERVKSGRYREVLRYQTHLAPIEAALKQRPA
jgi:hypothetical protein